MMDTSASSFVAPDSSKESDKSMRGSRSSSKRTSFSTPGPSREATRSRSNNRGNNSSDDTTSEYLSYDINKTRISFHHLIISYILGMIPMPINILKYTNPNRKWSDFCLQIFKYF